MGPFDESLLRRETPGRHQITPLNEGMDLNAPKFEGVETLPELAASSPHLTNPMQSQLRSTTTTNMVGPAFPVVPPSLPRVNSGSNDGINGGPRVNSGSNDGINGGPMINAGSNEGIIDGSTINAGSYEGIIDGSRSPHVRQPIAAGESEQRSTTSPQGEATGNGTTQDNKKGQDWRLNSSSQG